MQKGLNGNNNARPDQDLNLGPLSIEFSMLDVSKMTGNVANILQKETYIF